MRTLLPFFLSAIFVFIHLHMEGNIPPSAKQQFADLYPQVEAAFWEQKSNGYLASFESPLGTKKVYFDEDGRWQKSSLLIGEERLPATILRYVDRFHQNADAISFRLEYNSASVWYHVELEYSNRIVIKDFDETGCLQHEETIYLSSGISHAVVETPCGNKALSHLSPTPAYSFSGLEWFEYDLQKHRDFMAAFSATPSIANQFMEFKSGDDLRVALRRVNLPFQNVDHFLTIRLGK